MIIVAENCRERFLEALKLAAELNLVDNLLDRLDRLRTYANGEGCTYSRDEGKDTRCTLYPDFAPYSFSFVMEKFDGEWSNYFSGGLIYSGEGQPLDGSGPAFTVGIGTRDGWSIHT